MLPYRTEFLPQFGFSWKVDLAVRQADSNSNSNSNSTAGCVSGEAKKWRTQYKKVIEFKRKNGHCIVPQRYQSDKSLGRWVDNQRRLFTQKKLPPHREELLNEIGFVWKVNKIGDKRHGATRIKNGSLYQRATRGQVSTKVGCYAVNRDSPGLT